MQTPRAHSAIILTPVFKVSVAVTAFDNEQQHRVGCGGGVRKKGGASVIASA